MFVQHGHTTQFLSQIVAQVLNYISNGHLLFPKEKAELTKSPNQLGWTCSLVAPWFPDPTMLAPKLKEDNEYY